MDISEILSSLTDDDVEKLRSAAASIMGNGVNEQQKSEKTDSVFPPDMMKILGSLGNYSAKDNRTALIEALRPMLSEPRQQKADEAIKILRLINLIPLLRESGLLNGLL